MGRTVMIGGVEGNIYNSKLTTLSPFLPPLKVAITISLLLYGFRGNIQKLIRLHLSRPLPKCVLIHHVMLITVDASIYLI